MNSPWICYKVTKVLKNHEKHRFWLLSSDSYQNKMLESLNIALKQHKLMQKCNAHRNTLFTKLRSKKLCEFMKDGKNVVKGRFTVFNLLAWAQVPLAPFHPLVLPTSPLSPLPSSGFANVSLTCFPYWLMMKSNNLANFLQDLWAIPCCSSEVIKVARQLCSNSSCNVDNKKDNSNVR